MNCPRCGCELDDMSPTCPGCLAEPPLAPATGSDADDGADLPREELLRRYRNQQNWHRAYSECLDGIPEIRCMGGSGIDGCRMPDDIRRIVKTLVDHSQTTWEDGCMGRAKHPNAERSDPAP